MKQNYFTLKQSRQINKIYNEVQSYMPFEEATFPAFISKIIPFVREYSHYTENSKEYAKELFIEGIKRLADKYYPNGFKPSKKQRYRFSLIEIPRMNYFEGDYKPIEGVACMKVIRAFRDFSRSGLEEEEGSVKKLIKISNMLN